jgi:hypothetical protein
MDREQPDSILMVTDALTVLNRARVFDYATAHRLPAIYEYDFFVRDGGLMSYGPDFKQSFERAASLVDRIFKGARPADLPFEEPTKYLFVVNLKTAKSIGLELPPNLIALADKTDRPVLTGDPKRTLCKQHERRVINLKTSSTLARRRTSRTWQSEQRERAPSSTYGFLLGIY